MTNEGIFNWYLPVSYIFFVWHANDGHVLSLFLFFLSPEHSSSQSLKKLEKKPGPDETLQKCNKIEKMLLAAALSALKARRANATPVRPQVTVGSETLNDINLLMRLFQNRQSIHNSNIDDIMKLVSLLQNEITETHQTQEQPVTVSRFCYSYLSFKVCFNLILS